MRPPCGVVGEAVACTPWRPVCALFFVGYRLDYAVCGPRQLRCVCAHLALSRRAPFNGALVLAGTVLLGAQGAASIPGAVRLDVSPPVAGATKRVRSDLMIDRSPLSRTR